MNAAVFLHIAGQLAAAGISAWMAALAFSRPHIPGGRSFGWMNVAMVWWCLTGALHAFPQAPEARIVWATLQVAGISAVPPLWLLFAADYARAPWRRSRRRLLAAAASLMFTAAATNTWHGLYWPGVRESGYYLSYDHGPLFWAAVVWNYTLIFLGAVTLLRALRLQHRAFTGQVAALVGATLCPWAGNILYLAGLFPAGLDPTAFTFVFSGALITWGLYSQHLFDLVPAARATIFERIADAVFVLDRGFRVVDANAQAVALVAAAKGRDAKGMADDLIGRHPIELLPWWSRMERPPQQTDPLPRAVEAGDRQFEVQVTPLVGAQSPGSLLWVRDVTARRKAELEHTVLEKKLHAERRIESLTVLAAGLAHDFNNLLTAILGNADYLAATLPRDGEQRVSANAIATAAQHAADLVTQMVAFSGQGRAISGPVSLEDSVTDVIRALSRTLGERALVTHEGEPDLPTLHGDPVQIRQAVLALLTNAVDASADRHGSVEVVTGREPLDEAALAAATYSAATPGDFLYVEVRDEGAGMAPEVLQRVFEPFFSTRDLGRGLGLAAVHGIIRQHEGAIRIWTAPGEGTRVRVWFPLS